METKRITLSDGALKELNGPEFLRGLVANKFTLPPVIDDTLESGWIDDELPKRVVSGEVAPDSLLNYYLLGWRLALTPGTSSKGALLLLCCVNSTEFFGESINAVLKSSGITFDTTGFENTIKMVSDSIKSSEETPTKSDASTLPIQDSATDSLAHRFGQLDKKPISVGTKHNIPSIPEEYKPLLASISAYVGEHNTNLNHQFATMSLGLFTMILFRGAYKNAESIAKAYNEKIEKSSRSLIGDGIILNISLPSNVISHIIPNFSPEGQLVSGPVLAGIILHKTESKTQAQLHLERIMMFGFMTHLGFGGLTLVGLVTQAAATLTGTFLDLFVSLANEKITNSLLNYMSFYLRYMSDPKEFAYMYAKLFKIGVFPNLSLRRNVLFTEYLCQIITPEPEGEGQASIWNLERQRPPRADQSIALCLAYRLRMKIGELKGIASEDYKAAHEEAKKSRPAVKPQVTFKKKESLGAADIESDDEDMLRNVDEDPESGDRF